MSATDKKIESGDVDVEENTGSLRAAYSRLLHDLVIANRILYARKIVDGFGHVSVRHPTDASHFFLARSMAPALVTTRDILEFDLDGIPTEATSQAVYLERFIHSEVYKSRPDVCAIVHSHSPSSIPFGVVPIPLRPLYHMSAFLGTGIPTFDARDVAGCCDLLIRNPDLGQALAQCLRDEPAVLMRGHGCTVVGGDLPQAVFRAVYLEINAQLQAAAVGLGDVNYLTESEARLAAATNDLQVMRAWDLWEREVSKIADVPIEVA